MSTMTDILNSTPVVQGGLTLMVAGWLGYQLRALPGHAYDLLRHWCSREIEIREASPLYDAWLRMLTEGAARPGGPRTLEVRSVSGDDDQSESSTAFQAGSDAFWAKVCGKWCRVYVGRENGTASMGGGGDLMRRFIITVEVLFASKRDLLAMLAEAKRRANVVEDRQIVELRDRWGSRHTLLFPKRGPETLCLPQGLFTGIESRVKDFVASRAQYERVGIPWRFGLLLHGAPGTGKTSIAHVLASSLGLRLAVIPLADLRSDEDLVTAFTAIGENTIVLLEDVDSAFRQRKGKDVEGITFSGFLNCIDGMLAPHNGRVLVLSTNHLDRLDPALVRPGRVDLQIEVPALTKDAASDYVDRLFPHVATRHEIVSEVMAAKNPTPAMLINRLMRDAWHRHLPEGTPKALETGSKARAQARAGS